MNFSESETVEFKSIVVDDIKKEIIAFANTRGGEIYIGIDNRGNVCGVEDTDLAIQQIANSVRDSVKPDVTIFIRYRTIVMEGKNVVEVRILCGTHRPYYLAGKGMRPDGVFVRRGSSSVPASDMMIRQMIKETDGDVYECMRSLRQDLTFKKLDDVFSGRRIPFGETQMKTLGIVDGNGIYTNLGLLLSDQCPHIIKAATFQGTDNSDFHDRCEFAGSLLQQLEDAYAYIELRNNHSATFKGLLRIDHCAYPETALREALLNAIVHRDYGISAPTLLSVYDDRIEILSIGGLAGGITYEDMMLGVSHCRNKLLAEVFYRLQLIEAYGTGIGKMMSSYGDSVKKPGIQVTQGAFKVSLPNTESAQKAETGNEVGSPSLAENDNLLNMIHEKKSITRAEVETALGVSTSTARRMLLRLCSVGKIRPYGQGRNVIYLPVT